MFWSASYVGCYHVLPELGIASENTCESRITRTSHNNSSIAVSSAESSIMRSIWAASDMSPDANVAGAVTGRASSGMSSNATVAGVVTMGTMSGARARARLSSDKLTSSFCVNASLGLRSLGGDNSDKSRIGITDNKMDRGDRSVLTQNNEPRWLY